MCSAEARISRYSCHQAGPSLPAACSKSPAVGCSRDGINFCVPSRDHPPDCALDYVDEIGRENISAYEHDLLNYATSKLLTVPGLRPIGTAREKAGVLSFVLEDFRTEDVGAALNRDGIAVRAGHHSAQPILRGMGVESTVRPSLAFYNTCEDIDALVAALLRLQAGHRHRNS